MATFKIKDVEDQARLILLDTYSDAYRFEPKEIYQALWEGLKHIRSIRPESRYLDGLLVDLQLRTSDSSPWVDFYIPENQAIEVYRASKISMEDDWREAAVYYIVHRMYLKDDSDTQNANLATQYLNMFNTAAQI